MNVNKKAEVRKHGYTELLSAILATLKQDRHLVGVRTCPSAGHLLITVGAYCEP